MPIKINNGAVTYFSDKATLPDFQVRILAQLGYSYKTIEERTGLNKSELVIV